MNKVAFITGITGQTGSYLAEYLLDRDYVVHGIIRRASNVNTSRIDHIFDRVHLHYGDLTDPMALHAVLAKVKPSEIYHLAAMSHVGTSFEMPLLTMETNAMGTLRLLEVIRMVCPESRVYLAGTSEEFGNSAEVQNEETPLDPQSPYGISKVAAYHFGKLYREAYGMHIVIGHCFNHESPRRDVRFVTRKVTKAVARYVVDGGDRWEPLRLGNLDSSRDWSHAKDIVDGIYKMLHYKYPEDFVLSSGETKTIRELVTEAFAVVGTRVKWCSSGLDEKAIDADTTKTLVVVDKKYIRPAEVNHLLGDSSYARQLLGWKPEYSFKDIVREMVQHDVAYAEES